MDRWVTTQIAPVHVHGLMAGDHQIVAFLLQHLEDDPNSTRAVAAGLLDGVLTTVDGTGNTFQGEWLLSD